MKTLYVTDLDGTLLTPEKKVSPRTEEILNGLLDQGMLFTVATARSAASAAEILSGLRLRLPGILLNGALLYDFAEKRYIGCNPIKQSDARRVLEILRKHRRLSFLYKLEENEICVEYERLYNEFEQQFYEERKGKAYKRFQKVEELVIRDKDRVIYFTMLDEQGRLEPIYRELREVPGIHPVLYRDNYSGYYFLEIFSCDASKSAGIKKLKERCGAQCVVAFGDNLNDLDMLRYADVGLVVEDGVSEVKAAADGVILGSREDGVARYLNEQWK